MKPHLVVTLQQLALLGAVHEFVPLSTAQFGRTLGISQQSASVRVLELLDAGLIERRLGARRQELKITAKGLDALRGEYAAYRRIFEMETRIRIQGRLEHGLGEGYYYMSQEGYRSQFREKLGFDPFPGTLNLKLEGPELTKIEVLQEADGLHIEGFTDAGRTFGGAKCFPASLQKVSCATILPIRSHYQDVLEVISREKLRDRLGLRDGEMVEVDVRLEAAP
ncbi:MAG: DUF120 domain-containing protein [Thermoplasmata archaeon]